MMYGWKTTTNSVAHRCGDILLDANYGKSGENFRGKDFLGWHLYLSLFFFWHVAGTSPYRLLHVRPYVPLYLSIYNCVEV